MWWIRVLGSPSDSLLFYELDAGFLNCRAKSGRRRAYNSESLLAAVQFLQAAVQLCPSPPRVHRQVIGHAAPEKEASYVVWKIHEVWAHVPVLFETALQFVALHKVSQRQLFLESVGCALQVRLQKWQQQPRGIPQVRLPGIAQQLPRCWVDRAAAILVARAVTVALSRSGTSALPVSQLHSPSQ